MANASEAADLPDDPRLLQAVQEYLSELEGGHRPRRTEFLRRYPDLAGPLAQCLDGLELVHRAAHRDAPTSGGHPSPAAGPGPGGVPADPLGDFRVVREIGRGGMGVVYEAVQLSLGRKVALKVLPFAATFDARHLQRFRNEAQAAAQLHHSNIVPVYAVGCERGVHFYAMQLIEGQSLADVVRQVRQGTGRPADEDASQGARTAAQGPTPDTPGVSGPAADTASRLSLALSTQLSSRSAGFFRSAARLAAQAADALDHAHEFGIVHRDVKPANLLVDTHGRLWVTDFGLAQFHADAGLTQTGDILGTLRYMSPEQAYGQRTLLDHRTDVYSLGATLYELVTLEPIFPGRSRQELLRKIINEEPRPPRAVERTVPVELETIILKAVAKSPTDRYATAREMAEDLRRYLDDVPILARRPSLFDRLRKWGRRHPSVVAATVVVLLLCLAGLLVNNRMIAEEQAKTEAALGRENKRAEEAERRFRQARAAVDLLVEVSEQELGYDPPAQNARKKLLEAALGYYQTFLDEHPASAATQAELLAGQQRVRQILDELATLQGAHQLVLVTQPDVQDDLDLDSDQRDAVRQLSEQWSQQRLSLYRGPDAPPADQVRQKFVETARANEKALAGVLDATQAARLRQISLQLRGPLAFQDSEVVAALKLTAKQRQTIRSFKPEPLPEMRPGPGGFGGKGPPNDDRGRFGEPGSGPGFGGKGGPFEDHLRKELERIVAALTPEQQAQWRQMTGAPFQGRARLYPYGGPFGQRPGGRDGNPKNPREPINP